MNYPTGFIEPKLCIRFKQLLLGILKVCLFFNYALQPFKAYCAIWVRRSNF